MHDGRTLRETLIATAEAYCRRRGISLARLGNLVVRDGKFFDRIKAGGDCTTGVYERVMAYMDQHPPQGGDKPGEAAA